MAVNGVIIPPNWAVVNGRRAETAIDARGSYSKRSVDRRLCGPRLFGRVMEDANSCAWAEGQGEAVGG
jgi:hypothetical protein